MIRSFRVLSLLASLAASLAAPGARADMPFRADGSQARTTERSADEAMYDARYGMGRRNDAGQTALESSGATGGGGQHS